MKTVYLLGSGFTRGIVGKNALLNDDIMKKINEPKEYQYLMPIWDKTYPNIELYLSYLDLEWRAAKTRRKGNIRKYRENIIRQIRDMFEVNNYSVSRVNQYPDLDKFIKSIHACSYIITLNYDMILDQGLWLNRAWHPKGGYIFKSFPTEDENIKYKNIKVVKPHGSVNFWTPYKNYEKRKYQQIEISIKYFKRIPSQLEERDNKNEMPFLVPMTYIKVFRNGLMYLWREAIEEIKQAQKLVIIGCSIREEDAFLVYALYHFGMGACCNKPEVDIVLKGNKACTDVKRKIRNIIAWGEEAEIKTYPNGLSSYV